jgi:sterol desaturase/sphingolipid hydroxylase (fatty acid hydroxylase superfamily)
MIQDFPQLVKYVASRNPLHLLMFVLPLLSFFLFHALNTPSNAVTTVVAMIAGAVYWTFLEYVIHRFLYHTPFRNKTLKYFIGSFHSYHHQDMSDHRVLNAGFLMVYIVTPTVLSPLLLFTQDMQLLASLSVGLVSAHYFYEWVHYTLHYKAHQTGYLNYIQNYHFHHHDKAPTKNFGNTSHFWDVAFGTYDPAYKNYQMSVATQDTLITAKSDEEMIHVKA